MPDTDVADTAADDSAATDAVADDNTSTDDTSTDSTATNTGDDEAAKWKALAKKHESQSKANFAELEKLRKAQLSDTEKAIEDAKAEGRTEASKAFGERLAASELKAAGVPSEIVEDMALAKFIGDDGEVDAAKVAALGKKYAGLKSTATATGSADGGPQGAPKPGQLTQADLKGMSPEQIVEAKAKGQFNDLLGTRA